MPVPSTMAKQDKKTLEGTTSNGASKAPLKSILKKTCKSTETTGEETHASSSTGDGNKQHQHVEKTSCGKISCVSEKRERFAKRHCKFTLGSESDEDVMSPDEDLANLQRYRGADDLSPVTPELVSELPPRRGSQTSIGSCGSDAPEDHSYPMKGVLAKKEVHPRKISACSSNSLSSYTADEEADAEFKDRLDKTRSLIREALVSHPTDDPLEDALGSASESGSDVMPDDEDDVNFKRYTGRFRGQMIDEISGQKRVSFAVSNLSEWKPGMQRSVSEIADGSSMEDNHDEEVSSILEKRRARKLGKRISTESLSENDVQLAAQLIKDAMQTRTLFFQEDADSMKLYQLFNKNIFVVILYVCVIGDLSLVLFEKPAVSHLKTPYWAPMVAESIFLLYFLGRLLHNFSFDRRRCFWKEYTNMFLVLGITLTVLDMLIYVTIMEVAPESVGKFAVRWSRPLRPVFLVAFPSGERLRRAFTNVIKSLPEIFAVLVMLMCSIAIFALIWFQLLKDKGLVYSNGAPYFVNYFDSFWDLYVLVTTANNPDVMLPAYDYNNFFAILWFLYVCVNLYIFMNIVLAVVYNGYKTRLKSNVKESVLQRRRILEKTFDMLKMAHGGTWVVRSDTWHRVMSKVDERFSDTKIDLLLYVLDDNGNGCIEKSEFLMLSELISFDFAEVLEKKSWLEMYCKSYNSAVSVLIRHVVSHRYFEYVVDLLIVVNAGCITANLQVVEYVFLPLFTVEIMLRIYTLSPRRYFSIAYGGLLNILDFFLIFTPWVIFFLPSSVISSETKRSAMDFLLVLRILRVVRSAHAVEQFHMILSTIAKIAPFIFTYGGVVFTFFYTYAIVGMELFHGIVDYYGYDNLTEVEMFCGNPKLNGSEFWIKRYCGCNFNDFYHAIVVLFTLMVVNQWHEITNGFVMVTSKAARLYFMLFHMSCVIILLNIFSALIIEAFFIAYQVQRSDLQTYMQKKIKMLGLASGENNDDDQIDELLQDEMMSMTGWLPGRRKSTCDSLPNDLQLIRRRLKRDSRVSKIKFKIQDKSHMRVETLLQRLFAGELDMKAEEEEDGDGPQWATLDSVMDTYSDIAQYTTNQ